MKESCGCFIFIVLFFVLTSARETKLLVDLQEHGATAPRYTENSAYKVTSNNYEEFPGELTDQGILQMEKIGKDLRKGYIEDNQFLPNEFKPQNFYLKAYRDEPSVLSSYSSMLGAYPNSINWIQYQHMQGYSQAPFDRDDEEKVRNNLGLGTNPSKLTTREATIWSEANGRTFFNDPVSNCPQMQKQMEQNLEAANKKYTENRRFDALYEEMGETFDVNKNDINFKTAHLYLDDYITSQANQKPVPEFDEQVVADQWIQNYYRRYYYEGLYGDDNDLAKVASNHYFNYVLTSMYAKYKTDKGEINSDHYENLKYAQFTGNENAMIAAIKVLNEKNADPAMPPKFGSTIRYELFKDGDKYFVKGTLDGKPLNMNGDEDGVMPYEDFMNLVYNRLYFGDVDKYCQGTEPLHGKDKPILSSYEEHIWNTNPELRINQQLENRGNTKFVEQSFVELKQTPTSEPKPKPEPEPKVEQVVEEYTVYEPYIPAQQAPTQTYQPQVTPITQQRLYSTSSQPQRQYTIESRGPTTYSYPSKQYSKPASSQTYVTRMPQTTSQYVVAQPSDNVEFSNLVETSATQYNEPPKREFPKVYDPHTTRENKVDIPFLHPVEVDQLVHDTKVIKVPQKVVKEKIVKVPQPYYKEQVVKVPEKPTNIHHIDLSSEEVGPSVSFAQQEPAKSNSWPWWWWLPLLFLCCCLPLLCCLLWYFCCRKTTAPPPKKIPRAPSYRAEPKPIVKEETDIDRQKKYTYSKRKVDQEQEIENEIERELRVSRSRRTLAAQEKRDRPVVQHETRYIERPRIIKEENIGFSNKHATYDVVEKDDRQYKNFDDSYYVQQRPSRVERVVERTYKTGVVDPNDRRRSASRGRSTYVNERYRADGLGSPPRTGSMGYVSRELPRETVKEVITHQQHYEGSPRVVGTTGGEERYAREIIHEGDEVYRPEQRRLSQERSRGRGTSGEHRVISRDIDDEERRINRRNDQLQASPRSYTSNTHLRRDNANDRDMNLQRNKDYRKNRNFDNFDSEEDESV